MTKPSAAPTPCSDQPKGQTSILIYADGSCLGNPGPGGWAATLRRYSGKDQINYRAISGGDKATTNMRMEMTAIIMALGFLRPDETALITIRTDNLIIVRGMTEWLPGWIAKDWKKAKGKPVENRNLWEELIRLSEGRSITWEWVKGHAGDVMNGEVDRLAKAEAEKAQANGFID
ncbi:ribonuclease H family protein [Cypionkella psychrotolerans]|uniref:ribonuclease H family protein n=1 Tax=Cypionkella psychrotolerans TaxID=1678131 RepID=UPI0006B5367B|nr:ribonuclease H [Cypionkella psychrotolerans]